MDPTGGIDEEKVKRRNTKALKTPLAEKVTQSFFFLGAPETRQITPPHGKEELAEGNTAKHGTRERNTPRTKTPSKPRSTTLYPMLGGTKKKTEGTYTNPEGRFQQLDQSSKR